MKIIAVQDRNRYLVSMSLHELEQMTTFDASEFRIKTGYQSHSFGGDSVGKEILLSPAIEKLRAMNKVGYELTKAIGVLNACVTVLEPVKALVDDIDLAPQRAAEKASCMSAIDRLHKVNDRLLEALQHIVNDTPAPGEDAELTTEGYNKACEAIAFANGDTSD